MATTVHTYNNGQCLRCPVTTVRCRHCYLCGHRTRAPGLRYCGPACRYEHQRWGSYASPTVVGTVLRLVWRLQRLLGMGV